MNRVHGISPLQVQRIESLVRTSWFDDEAHALAYFEYDIGRSVESLSDLTFLEAGQIIELLAD